MVLFLILLAIVATAACVAMNNSRRRADHEEFAAAHPLEPRLEAVLRRGSDDGWRARRDVDEAVRRHTPAMMALLRDHGEQPTLVVFSDASPFGGLLFVTTGRSVFYGSYASSARPIPHAVATTRIRGRGDHDPKPWVTIEGGGQQVHLGCASLTVCRLVCAAIDNWAEADPVVPDPRVVVTRFGVQIPPAFYVDTLRAAGHAPTPFNLRSVHERFGMQFHSRAYQYIGRKYGEDAAHRFTSRVGRPERDEDLPDWPTRVFDEWIAVETDVAHVMAVVPHQVRAFLLEMASEGGDLSDPSRPLTMWRSAWYADGGSGPRLHRTSIPT